MQDVYKTIDECNANEERKILMDFDVMIATHFFIMKIPNKRELNKLR